MNPLVRIFVHQRSMSISILLHFSLSLYCFSILFSFIAFCHSNPSTPFLLFSNNLLPYELIDILPCSTSSHFSCFDVLSPTISLTFSHSISFPPSPFLSLSLFLTISLSSYSLDNLYPLQLFIWEHLRQIYGTFRRVECR